MPSDVRRMRGNLVGNDSGPHVILVGQAEVLFRRDIAEHGSSIPADHRSTDGRSDVIIPGGDVGDQRPERIERSFVTKLVFLFHLHLDLIQGNVAGALDHHLDVVLPGLFGQIPQRLQLGELRLVAGVGNATRAQAVAEREAYIVFREDLADILEALV